jgi:ATP-dependent protease HslVU (ClpYQ) peptidase subunit
VTAIVAVRYGDCLTMGADRCVSGGGARGACDESKILQRTTKCGQPVLIGMSGDVTYCQLWNSMRWPAAKSGETGYEYMVRMLESSQGKRVVPVIKKRRDGSEYTTGPEGMVIVSLMGQNIEVDCEGGIVSYATGEACIGSGGPWAQGALYVTRKYRLSSEDRVRLSLEAAAAHSPGVMGPFDVVTITSNPPEPVLERRKEPRP